VIDAVKVFEISSIYFHINLMQGSMVGYARKEKMLKIFVVCTMIENGNFRWILTPENWPWDSRDCFLFPKQI